MSDRKNPEAILSRLKDISKNNDLLILERYYAVYYCRDTKMRKSINI